mgnify:CR=1 FL=1
MILLLMISVGLIGANSLILSPIAADVARGLGAGSAADVMTASAIYGIGVAGSALLLASRADRVGAPKALQLALCLVIVGLGLSTAAPSLWWLSIGQGIAGIGVGMALPAIYSLAAIISPKGQEARTMGMVLTGWTLSMVGGVTASAYISELAGWRTVFGVLSIGMVAILVTIRRTHFPHVAPSGHATSPISALKVSGIMPALFSVAVLGTGFYGIYNYLGAHLVGALDRSVSDAGWLTLSYGLGFGAAMLFDPWLDRVGPRRGLLVVFAGLSVFYVGMSLVQANYVWLIAAMFGWGVLQHLGLNLTVSRLSMLDPGQRGAIMGLNSTMMYLSVFCATILFRPAFEFNGIQMCMWISASLAVLGAGEAITSRLRAKQTLAS